ncbi:MAG: hypothetical protein C5B50_13505 [Verrucomicrobia bacterium]|nr:MAG: hypothetical protein C5B50_13505 [Verrucomicrobiota bacterium]
MIRTKFLDLVEAGRHGKMEWRQKRKRGNAPHSKRFATSCARPASRSVWSVPIAIGTALDFRIKMRTEPFPNEAEVAPGPY